MFCELRAFTFVFVSLGFFNFCSYQLLESSICSLQIFVTLGNLGVLIFFQCELWGSLVSILWTLGVFCFVHLKFKVFNFLVVLGVLKKIGWNFAYGRWMGSLGFFLWTLGGSCFLLFFDKNSRVYKNVLSFWGFSKNILWSFTTKEKKGYSLLQNVGVLH